MIDRDQLYRCAGAVWPARLPTPSGLTALTGMVWEVSVVAMPAKELVSSGMAYNIADERPVVRPWMASLGLAQQEGMARW